ncbi:MAG: DUF6036 family nucleotidyltransferase [Planctomycetota bacterium]
MPATADKPDLWDYVRQPGHLVASELYEVAAAAARHAPDYRERWLIHESLAAVERVLGKRYLAERIAHESHGAELKTIQAETFEEGGWPSLRTHVMAHDPNQMIRRMLDELGRGIRRPTQITVGGSSALLLSKLLVRSTEDVDVVDELPEAIRTEYDLLDRLADEYKIRMTHFASHYLPDCWANRVQSLGVFRKLSVRIVDPLDVLTGKFFTRRDKDFADIKACWDKIDQQRLRNRLATSTASYRENEELTSRATDRWAILTGEESLPG